MNVTQRALLQRYLSTHIRIVEMDWWQVALLWVGAVTVLALALVALFFVVDKLCEGWLRARRNADVLMGKEIPDFVRGDYNRAPKRTHTAALSVVEMKNEGEGR